MGEYKQQSMFPGHEPVTDMKSAKKWAAGVVGRGAKVSYISPEDNYHMLGQHLVKISRVMKKGAAPTTIGEMHWSPSNGMITSISVHPDFRERGIATGLWNIGRALGTEFPGINRPIHSDVQTPLGRQWAKKVGD